MSFPNLASAEKPSSGLVRLSGGDGWTNKQRPIKGAAGAERASAARLEMALQQEFSVNDSTVFVITRRGSAFIESPVFSAGDEGREEAVAVFTEKQSAQEYIEQAKWASTSEAAALSPNELRAWLIEAQEQGAAYAAVNPARRLYLAGDLQPVLTLRGIGDLSNERLLQLLRSLAEDPPGS